MTEFVAFLSLSKQILGQPLKMGKENLLPHAFQFIPHSIHQTSGSDSK